MSILSYRGYTARVEVDTDDEILVGRVLGLRDVIGFHGRNVEELRAAFHEAVDNYLAVCEQLGQAPERPASGRVMLRIPPEVHASALIAAQACGQELQSVGRRCPAKGIAGLVETYKATPLESPKPPPRHHALDDRIALGLLRTASSRAAAVREKGRIFSPRRPIAQNGPNISEC